MIGPGAPRTLEFAGLRVVLMDDLEPLAAEHAGAVVVTGSHGGLASGRRAIRTSPLLVVFNDAGVGKDRAGVAALELLQGFNVAAAAVAADSARIGDAEDTLAHGVIAHCNERAAALGLRPGATLREALRALPGGDP